MTLRRTLTGSGTLCDGPDSVHGLCGTGPAAAAPADGGDSAAAVAPPLYFVNVSSLALREGPTTAAPQIGTLHFNDEVQILETSSGWARVGDVRRDRTAGPPCATCSPYRLTGRSPCPGSARHRLPRSQPKPAESPKAM